MPSETAYPLSWPVGWKRTAPSVRKSGNFKTGRHGNIGERPRALTVTDGVSRVVAELRRFGIPDYSTLISTNVPLARHGFPASGHREPADPGVAVYWRDGERRQVMAIDRYDRVADNLGAIAATLDAMRAIERHGGAMILERAFTGFAALPAPGQASVRGWREVFGFADDRVDRARLDGAYRTARANAHPDRAGGSAEAFHEVQLAYEQALQELRL